MLEKLDTLSVNQLKCLDELRLILQDCPLLVIPHDNEFLYKFLCLMNWDVDKTYQRIIAFYKFKKDNPKYFLFGPIDVLERMIRSNAKFLLDKPDRYGRWVYIVKVARYVEANNVYEIAQVDDLWFSSILNHPGTIKNGISVLIDAKDVPLRLVSWVTPKHSRVMSQKSEIAPFRITYHIVNSSRAMNLGVKLVFPLLSAEAKKTIHFHHSDWDSLHQWIGKEVLPTEYGGSVTHIDYEKLRERIYRNEAIILENMTYGFVEPEPANWSNQCS
ncbi:CRAL-TRIO domain-containing protein [Sergentomyia squamirostris]